MASGSLGAVFGCWALFLAAGVPAQSEAGGTSGLWSVGGSGEDRIVDAAVLADGSLIVLGTTSSHDGPPSVDFGPLGASDVFLACLDLDRGELLWSTRIGGSDAEQAAALGLGSDGSIFVAGITRSVDLPVTEAAFQRVFVAGSPLMSVGDSFLARFSSGGRTLSACSYLGREGDDVVTDLLVEDDGSVVVCGHTTSQVFPTTDSSLQQSFGSVNVLVADGFVTRMTPELSELVWSTYFGGRSADSFHRLLARPGGGYLLGGWHSSADLPVPEGRGAVVLSGLRDAMVVELSRDGRRLDEIWSFGGEGFETVTGLAASPDGRLFACGYTDDAGEFPAKADPPRRGAERFSDESFVVELAADGELAGSVLFGGPAADRARCLSWVDGLGLVVGGESRSHRFPLRSSKLLAGQAPQVFVLSFDSELRRSPDAFRSEVSERSSISQVLEWRGAALSVGSATRFRLAAGRHLGGDRGFDSTDGLILRTGR